MKQKITGFRLDEEQHWVAELECGHGQHVRHDPPWTERPWTQTPEGRASRLGQQLECKRCDELALSVAVAVRVAAEKTLIAAYEDAGISGLCADGRWEAAVDSIKRLDLAALIKHINKT